MGVIRGKLFTDSQWRPNVGTVGDWPSWLKRDSDGHWFDSRTGEKVRTMSFAEFLDGIPSEHSECAECMKKRKS